MKFNEEKAQGLLDEGLVEAEELLKDTSKIDDILIQLEEKLKKVPAIGDTLSGVPLVIAMIKAWITKEYTEVSAKVIVCLVSAILYLVKKKDLIPDNIPIIGIADDLGVMALALKMCEPELKKFSEWRAAKNGAQA